jgi:hypothetical protein
LNNLKSTLAQQLVATDQLQRSLLLKYFFEKRKKTSPSYFLKRVILYSTS